MFSIGLVRSMTDLIIGFCGMEKKGVRLGMSNSPSNIILVCTGNSHCAISSITNPGMYVKYHLPGT